MYAQIRLCRLTAGLGLAAALLGCATADPPRELTEAQAEFQKASTGPAASVNPAGLLQAKKALDRADQEFKEHPNAPSTRDFAYVALRRAQLAEVQADTLLAAQQKAEANRQARELQAQRQSRAQQQTEQELRQTRQQLAESGAQAQRNEQQRQLAAQADNNDGRNEVSSRREAERVRAKLANVAAVRQEPRGVVIAFPESALFAEGRSTLKPSAKSKLNRVAAALADGDEKIVIEGHTDAIGSNRLNAGLSERRAITVRNYLRERGISPDRMTAVGFGGTRPLASDSTPQGRAKNRRVEIVVQLPAALSTG